MIAKYLAGEALPEEALLLDDWKAAAAANLRYFEECEKTFPGVIPVQVNSKKMFEQVRAQLQLEQPRSNVFSLQSYFTPVRIAAAILIVAFAGTGLFMLTSKQEDVILSANEKVNEQLLADGSKVTLNKNAVLTLENGLKGKKRKLKLKGEAFFEVKHDDAVPFVIDAGGVEITDIGTAFNVKAEAQSDSVLVVVTEGVVSMSNSITVIEVKANESAVYIRSTRTLLLLKSAAPENTLSYKTKIFHFNAATLGEVIAQVNTVYGPVLRLEHPELAACRITVDFRNETPETIVAILTETLGLGYHPEGDGYLITGEACIQ